MRRRHFFFLAGGVAAWPLVARGQAVARPVVGYLSSSDPDVDARYLATLRQGLAQHGFVEGRNLTLEPRWSEGDYARLQSLAAELVGRKVDLLMTSGLPATLAAQKATSTIPIVFRLAI